MGNLREVGAVALRRSGFLYHWHQPHDLRRADRPGDVHDLEIRRADWGYGRRTWPDIFQSVHYPSWHDHRYVLLDARFVSKHA